MEEIENENYMDDGDYIQYYNDNNSELDIKPCNCDCRFMMRWLERQNDDIINYGYFYKSLLHSIIISLYKNLKNDIIIDVLKEISEKEKENYCKYPKHSKLILMNYIDIKYQNQVGKKKYMNDLLNQYMSYFNANVLFNAYNNCDCCEKHMRNRPLRLKKPDINIDELNMKLKS